MYGLGIGVWRERMVEEEVGLANLKSALRLFMIRPVDRGVINSVHRSRLAGSSCTAKLVIQLTRADSA